MVNKTYNICITLSPNMEIRFSLTVFVIISCLLSHLRVTRVGRALKCLQIFQISRIHLKLLGTSRVTKSSFILRTHG